MKTFSPYCFFILLLLQMQAIQAQTPPHYLEQLTTEDGLSSNETTDIIQDHKGFLWIGTKHGLSRYDGSEIIQFFTNGDSLSLANNVIHRLIKVDAFHIAVATDHGLSILDTRTNTFHNIYFNFDLEWNAYDNQLLFMEKDANGNIWIGTPVSIYRLDKNLQLEKVFRSRYTQSDIGKARISYVYRIIPLSTGEVLIWLGSGLHIWNPDSDTLIKIKKSTGAKWSFLANSSFFQCAHVYSHFLVYLNNSTQKLIAVDEQTGRKVYCSLPLNNRKHIAIINNISELRDGWIALSFAIKGMSLVKLQRKNGKFRVSHENKVYFPNTTFRKGMEGREGNRWFTTGAHGLFKISPGKHLFTQKDLIDKKTQIRSPFEIISFYKMGKKLFIATYGGGFFIWELTSGKLRHLSAKYGPDSENMVWNFGLQNQDTLWIGTQQGLLWYDIQNEHIGRIVQDHPKVFDSSPITTQFKDSHNLVWMGLGRGRGVGVYNKTKNSFRVFPNTDSTYPYRYPVSIAEDKNSNLWFVSDATANLVLWERKIGRFKKIVIPQFKGKTYVHTGMLYLDKKNNVIWYGVQNAGLVRYDIATGNVKTYGIEYGLSTDMIYSIVKDKYGILWLATAQGITSFDPVRERFVNYSIGDGLPAATFSADFFYDRHSDIIYAGTPGYVVYFSPGGFTGKKPALHAIITGIKINNEPVQLPQDHYIKLPWKSNDITLSFTAVNLTDGQENKYAYKLGGHDAQWNELDGQKQIRFASLNPGNYIFTIKAARRDGAWSPFTDQFQFTIRPPFVKTIWFYLLTFLLIGGLIYGWYKYRLINILRLEEMRARISHDLHDDIGSRITNIALMSQIARRKKHDHTQKNNWLTRIQEESEAISQAMREIIWNINPDNDSMAEAMPRMLRFASGLLEAKGITVQAYIPDLNDIEMDMEKRRDLFLIFKEIIHNITRHSDAKQTVISVSYENKLFRLNISDDGKGFEKDGLAFQNGLHNMQQRAEKNHWLLKIISKPGNGTQVLLKIKIT